MSKKKQAVIPFRASDGRKAAVQITFAKDRLEIYVEVAGSNKLRKIGESSALAITIGPGYDKDAIAHLFSVLNS